MKTIKKLKEMNIPHMQLGGIVKVNNSSEENINSVNTYLNNFIEPTGKCIRCESDIGGFLGTFTWGITWGEGYCRKCGYPIRANHCIKNDNGEEIVSITNFALQYHPDILEDK